MSFPAFELTITNNTGHVVRFNRAVLKAQDDAGQLFDCSMKSDLIQASKTWIETDTMEREIYWHIAPALSKMRQLKLIDNNFELLPGFTQKAYLSFNWPIDYYNGYHKFITSIGYIKVMLFEVPIVMDEAGEVKKTTNFTYFYNINSKIITVK